MQISAPTIVCCNSAVLNFIGNISSVLKNDSLPILIHTHILVHTHAHTSLHTHTFWRAWLYRVERKVCYRKNCPPWASYRPVPSLGSPEIHRRALFLFEFLSWPHSYGHSFPYTPPSILNSFLFFLQALAYCL